VTERAQVALSRFEPFLVDVIDAPSADARSDTSPARFKTLSCWDTAGRLTDFVVVDLPHGLFA
jgi:hypothetical protein